MRIITKLALAAVGIGAVLCGGFLAPDQVVIKRHAITTASPEAVLQLAASSEGYQTFSPYRSSDPDLMITPFGPKAGIGSGFGFDGKDGSGTQTVVSQTHDRIGYQIQLDGMGTSTQAIQVRPTAQGTEIEWSMHIPLGNNLIMRWMGLMLPAMLGATLEDGLTNLTHAVKTV